MLDNYPLIAFAVQVAAASALILAGGLKLAQPAQLRAALQALGVAQPSVVTAILGVAELGGGASLILAPGSWLVAGWVLVLGMMFGAAGVVAIVRRVHVQCACFGWAVFGQLGWRQVALTPAWVLVAGSVVAAPIVLPDQRVLVTAGLLMLVVLSILLRLELLAREHRTQRRIIAGG
jgi:hypothetical protein